MVIASSIAVGAVAFSLLCFFLRRVHGLVTLARLCTRHESPAVWSAASVSSVERVDMILQKIQGSDSGANLSSDQKKEVDGMIEQLEKGYQAVELRPIDDPAIMGNYRVSYVSTGSGQVGNPAGGRWRGAFGKAIFRTTGLYQNLFTPNGVVNIVGFNFLSFLKGLVVLKGTFTPIKDKPDFVRADFEKPRLCLRLFGSTLFSVAFDIGPTSAVELDCAYIDDRVRLGRGSRGSRFVFERTTDKAADEWEPVANMRAVPLPVASVGLVGLLFLLFRGLQSNALIGAVCLGLLILYGLVFRGGGIIDADAIDKKPATGAA
uniref:Plastid lipid-associated protein/fibrillin conserved domain-containing protein n=1 Tax=Eutreptiella gymnastica TaxID=73025 RepID=A0A7S1NG46_9EUGL